LLASGSYDQTVKIWDTRSYRHAHTLSSHDLIVSDVDWSGDSSLLVSASYDSTVKVWDTETGSLLHTEGVSGFAQTCTFSPTSNALFFTGTANNEMVLVDWRRSGGSKVAMRFANDTMVNSMCVFRGVC
ncbi:hypothetical protein SARC_13975, partial [Sphaeroforma arctica JP610]